MTSHDAARLAVARAVRAGKLRRPSHCPCGRRALIHAHHEDYGRPLDVTWLCATCHQARHRELQGLPPRPARSRPLTARIVREALIRSEASPTRAAALLKVSRQTVHAWMRASGIAIERVVTE